MVLDALFLRPKHHAKRVDPDIDGFSQAQSPVTESMVQLKVVK
jgi:hypothetical protein